MGKKVKIYNPATGETKIVDESELGAYGAQAVPQGGFNGQPASLSPQNATLEPVGGTEEQPQQKGLIQGLLEPFIKTGKNILGAPVEAARAFHLDRSNKALEENTKQMAEITQRLKTEKDPEVKKILMSESKKLQEVAGVQREKLSKVRDFQNPFLNDEDFKKIDENPRGYLTDQVKDSAEIASYGIPFGKAGFFGSKFLAPGFAVGATQAATTDEAGLDWKTADSVLFGGLKGAGLGISTKAGSWALGKTLKGTSGLSGKLEEGAQAIEQGQRKIKLPAGVYSAGEEKAVNKTLTKYGIQGGPDEQYALLEPTMNKIEEDITKVIANNPNVKVPRSELLAAFQEKVKSSVRSGDLKAKQAQTEVQSYLDDVLKASGGTGKFKDIDLGKIRQLKKLINEDYKSVDKAITNGTSLSPRQKVIQAAWGAVDDAVQKYSDEMSTLLTDESNLYKSAKSLSAGRFNAPTERFMGTSIPAPIENAGKSKLIGLLRGASDKTATTSNVAGKVDNVTSNPMISQIMQRGIVRSPQVLSDNKQVPDNENQNDNPQDMQLTDTLTQPQATATGYSLEQLGQAYAAAIQANDKASADQLKNMYDMEANFQKTQGGAQKLTQRQSMFKGAGESAQDALNILESGQAKVGPITGLLQSGGSKVGLADDEQVEYQATISIARSALLNAFLGGNIPPTEYKRIADSIPQVTDPTRTAKQKLKTFIKEMERYASGNVQESAGGYQTGSTSDY